VCFAVVVGKSAREVFWKKRFFAAGSRNPFLLWGGAHDDGTTKELTNILKRKGRTLLKDSAAFSFPDGNAMRNQEVSLGGLLP